ncbi:MAG: LysM peptidoglycan-binding domain-containing protein, partial [Gammaproteobacteria bacterium]
LAKTNHLSTHDPLKIGQQIVVKSPRASASIDMPNTDLGPSNTTRKVHYRVRSGDSLFRIADKFKVSTHDISRWNDLEQSHILHPGQQLVLYVDVRETATR